METVPLISSLYTCVCLCVCVVTLLLWRALADAQPKEKTLYFKLSPENKTGDQRTRETIHFSDGFGICL